MEPSSIVLVVIVLAFVIAFYAIAFASANSMSTAMFNNIKPVSTDDFLRLLAREDKPVVFYMKTTFGAYCYFATFAATQIVARSKRPVDFPDDCELIELKRK